MRGSVTILLHKIPCENYCFLAFIILVDSQSHQPLLSLDIRGINKGIIIIIIITNIIIIIIIVIIIETMCIWYRSYTCIQCTYSMCALWIENTNESDPCSYEATEAVAMKAQKQILRLQWDLNPWPLQYQCKSQNFFWAFFVTALTPSLQVRHFNTVTKYRPCRLLILAPHSHVVWGIQRKGNCSNSIVSQIICSFYRCLSSKQYIVVHCFSGWLMHWRQDSEVLLCPVTQKEISYCHQVNSKHFDKKHCEHHYRKNDPDCCSFAQSSFVLTFFFVNIFLRVKWCRTFIPVHF